jgi:hypothetical protein
VIAGGFPKFFYEINNANIPDKLKADLNMNYFRSTRLGGAEYEPVYIGASEAEMMKEEKIFSKEGDILNDFFGNKAIISGILPKTETPLDYFHFVDKDLVLKK